MKHKFGLLLVLLASIVAAQGPEAKTFSSVTFPVYTLNATPVAGANLQVIGAPGQATWCYWGVANFQIGSVISSLGCVQNAPNTLSGSNYVSILPWGYPPSSASIDILATPTFVQPTGACACAVATGLTTGGTNQQSNTTSAYTVSLLNSATFNLVLRNEVVGSASTHLLLRNAFTGALVSDLSSLGGGCVPLSSNVNGVLYLNGTPVCTSNTDFTFSDGAGGAFLRVGGVVGGNPGTVIFASPTLGSTNISVPQTGTGDLTWFSVGSSGGLSIGTSSVGGNIGIASGNNLAPQAITAISRTTNVVTVTFTPGFNVVIPASAPITIANVTDSSYNGTFKALTSTAGSVTYSQTAGNSSSSGGTIAFHATNSISSTNGPSGSATANEFSYFSSGGGSAKTDGSFVPAMSFIVTGTKAQGTNGGDISFFAGGTQDTGADTTEPAGNINLFAGPATGGNNAGGNINLFPGPASGTGATSKVAVTGLLTASTYGTPTNCAVNSASPAACGSAAAGAVVIPTTTTTYTINTSAVTSHSRIQVTWLTFASDLPSAPTCVAPVNTTEPTVSAVSAGVSFTIALGSTTGQTCPQYTITN